MVLTKQVLIRVAAEDMSNQKQIAKPSKAKDKREKQKKSSSSRKDKAIALVKNAENLDDSSFTVRSSSFQTSGLFTLSGLSAP